MAGERVARTAELFYSGQWNDITADALNRDPVTITRGVANEGGQADPGTLHLTLNNGASKVNPAVSNRYARGNALSDLYGLLTPNTPLRVSAGLAGGAQTVRMVAETVALPPRSDVSQNDLWVPVEAAGVLRRLGIPSSPLPPALQRSTPEESAVVASWPLAGLGQGVTRAPSSVAGVAPLAVVPANPELFAFEVKWSADNLAPGLGACPVAERAGSSVGFTASLPPGAGTPFGQSLWGRGAGDNTFGGLVTLWVDTDLTLWLLRVDWSGPALNDNILVTVFAFDAATSAFEVSLINTNPIPYTDRWLNAALIVDQDGADADVTVLLNGEEIAMTVDGGSLSGITIGNPAAVRAACTRPTNTGTGTQAIGHPTVVAGQAAGSTVTSLANALARLYRAGRGYDGEMAGDRVERVCLESGVSIASDRQIAIDEFERTESNGWGTAPTGQSWSHTGGDLADYAVSSGEATMDIDTLDSPRLSTLATSERDVDARLLVRAADGVITGAPAPNLFAGLSLRQADVDNAYLFRLLFGTAGLVAGSITSRVGGSNSLLALTGIAHNVAYDSSTVVALRAQIRGNVLRLKLWDSADPEPPLWAVEVVDDTFTGAGSVGVVALLDGDATNTLPYTVGYQQIEVRSTHRSALLGPQHPEELLAVLGEAAKVEAGGSRAPVLVEQRTGNGLHFRTLASMSLPRTPALELDYEAAHLSPPFDPTPDDFGLVNDARAGRRDGGEAQIEQFDGPKGITAAGRYDAAQTFGVLSDEHLDGIARYWTVHGTWDEDRYPVIRINLRGLSTRTDGAALVAAAQALDPGALIRIVNPPAWLPAQDIDQIVLGITETISTDEWLLDLHTTAARPFTVAVLEDNTVGLAQSDSATLDEALDTTETAVDIDAGAGPDWVHDGVDYDLVVGGERMTVTGVGAMSGTFPARKVTLTVTRSVNGIVKSHASGAKVEWATKAYIGLWG